MAALIPPPPPPLPGESTMALPSMGPLPIIGQSRGLPARAEPAVTMHPSGHRAQPGAAFNSTSVMSAAMMEARP